MFARFRRYAERLAHHAGTPINIRRVNGWATVAWFAVGIPLSVIWSQSILWVALISIWANVISHYTAWVAARVEVRAQHVEIEVGDD